ncbi:MAG: FAD-dependent oxidoreductase, partial [Bacteroidales bacterium]
MKLLLTFAIRALLPMTAILSFLCDGCGSNPFHKTYDVCVYGGTSSGVIAAISAARSGCKVLLVEPTSHIGGLTTGGLGYT